MAENYRIVEINGLGIDPTTGKMPVEITSEPHALFGPQHYGVADDSQIPVQEMRVAQHQLDPHTMVIDGRVIHVDGAKLDTIEPYADVNNLTDQQAHDLTSGINCNWHIHDNRYYTQTQLQTAGMAVIEWLNLIDVPSSFNPNIATSSTLGGVIIGSGINVSSNGTISVIPYSLPVATQTTLGGVIVGQYINVNSNGVISIDNYEPYLGEPTTSGFLLASTAAGLRNWVAPYSLPAATTSTLGGVIVGTNISVSAGTISVTNIPWSIISSTPTTVSGYGIVMTSSDVTTALGYTPVNTTLIGAANGLATLDGSGHLTSSQIPSALVGSLVYQGVWNATTNTPALASGVGTKGWYYKVSVGGTTSIDGTALWEAGDMIVFDGTAWDRIAGGSTNVETFNGRVGVVTLSSSDVTTALTYTPYNATNPAGYLNLSTLPIGSTTVQGILEVGGQLSVSNGVVSYTLPAATASTLGGVIVGTGLNVTTGNISVIYAGTGSASSAAHSDHTHSNNSSIGGPYELALGSPSADGYLLSSTALGVRSWIAPYSLPVATTSALGGVKVGTNINVAGDGTISVTFPAAYTLPIATSSVLGGVKIGANVSVAGDGTISVATPYVLPQATTSVLGGVVVGSNIDVSNGVISIANYELALGNPSTDGYLLSSAANGTRSWIAPYSLPAATGTTLGGVIIGTGINNSSGTISVTPYTLPAATSSTLGGVIVGSGINVTAGTISVTPYTLPAATTSTLGGVIVGTNISVSSGTISVATATTAVLGVVKVGTNISVSSGTISVATATTSALGVVKVGTNISVASGVISVATATSSALGVVKPDGTIITVSSGAITVATATTSALGVVKPDGTTITVSSGVISVGSIPWSSVNTTPTTISGYGIVMTSSDVTTALGYTPINSNQIGVSSGLATLDGSGHLTSSQIPTSLVGALVYQGTWNATTNTPTLSSGVGTKGYYYKINVAGTTTIDGNSQWNVGDMIVYDGTVWDKIDGLTSEVTSVFGRVGAITLLSSDVTTALGYTPYNSTNPAGYLTLSTLPIASNSVFGIVEIGSGINVSNGVISVTPYSLPQATISTLGGVIVGSGINVTNGTISVTPYTLTPATTSTLGGVVVGSNINVDVNGVISIANYELALGNPSVNGYLLSSTIAGARSWVAPYSLPTATISTLGGVKVDGTTITITNGTISAPYTYTLPAATATTLGGVIVGYGLSVNGGTISVNFPTPYTLPAATTSTLGGVIVGSGINVSNGTISVTPYTLSIATTSILGGVKIGNNVTVGSDGTISVAAPYSLPAATTSSLGGVIVGSGLSVSTGTISVNFPTPYTLPVATSSVLGGVKIGANVSVGGDGTISVAAPYSLPTASTTVLGGVKTDGTSITISSGVISAPYSYTLPIATSSVLGGVKVGTNISVDGAGTISVVNIPWSIVSSTPTTIAGYGITLTSSNVTTALGYTPVNSNLVGAASGLATLDATGKLTTAQIPSSLVGALNYQGTWNASTNTPTLASGTGTKGYYYKVSAAGTTTLDGVSQWFAGDLVIFDGTTWDRVEGEATNVYSFNTRSGAVTLTSSDVTTALTYTPYNSTNPAGYLTAATLPVATGSSLGVVQIGSGISVSSGIISVTPYTLPTASTTILGGVKIDGTTITISSGVISAAPYTDAIATTSTPGDIIVGSGLSITSSTLSVVYAGTGSANSASHSDHTHTNSSTIGGPYELSLGNPSTNGYVLSSTTSGTRSWVAQSSYTLPQATASILGGVIVGSNISVSNGVISIANYEPALGNPSTNGYVLSSTTSGTRSWVSVASSLQSAYNGGQTVNVSGSNVIWQLPVSKGFTITDGTGANTMFSVYGNNTSGSFALAGNLASSITVSGVALSITANGSGSSIALTSAGALTLDDQYLTGPLPISESGTTGLSSSFSGHATSIVGAINYMQTEISNGGVQNGVLQLTNQSSAPTGSAGQVAMINSILYFYDANRSKWLTPSMTCQCAKSGASSGFTLRWPDNVVGNGQSGLTFHKKGTIVGCGINTTTTGSPAVGMLAYIQINGSNVATLQFDSAGDALYTNLNIDFNPHDVLSIYVEHNSTQMMNPIANVEYSWRPA
jgi:hypothetical protein